MLIIMLDKHQLKIGILTYLTIFKYSDLKLSNSLSVLFDTNQKKTKFNKSYKVLTDVYLHIFRTKNVMYLKKESE